MFTQNTILSCIYNVADDGAISTNELVQLIGEASGKKVSILKIPKALMLSLAKIGTVLGLPFNMEKLQKLTENYVVSNQKIVSAIGKPLPIESKEGLLKTFQSFKK